jgi:hypothetical protein
MADVCLNLLTKIEYSEQIDPLENIWSLQHWCKNLDRVKAISKKEETQNYQRFELIFDADRDQPDCVEIERFRRKNEIEVKHIIPPPGIHALSAKWWICPEQGNILFAKRKILIDASAYTPVLARKMFFLLRANLEKLIEV